MSILVTGFEPFGGSSRNASWEAVSLLPETIAGHAVYRMRLPVCYGQAGDLLVEMMRRIRPTVTLCCGVAGGRKAITPELIAVNYRRAAIADNADVLYAGEKIDPKRPDAHMTRLNILRMVDAMKSAGLPADLSLTAGAYVCRTLLSCCTSIKSVTGRPWKKRKCVPPIHSSMSSGSVFSQFMRSSPS